jgi:hypothetical protein
MDGKLCPPYETSTGGGCTQIDENRHYHENLKFNCLAKIQSKTFVQAEVSTCELRAESINIRVI